MANEEKRKADAEMMASMLEQKAKELREKGISAEDMDSVAGGGWDTMTPCCGSFCYANSSRCSGCNASCAHSCVGDSAT